MYACAFGYGSAIAGAITSRSDVTISLICCLAGIMRSKPSAARIVRAEHACQRRELTQTSVAFFGRTMLPATETDQTEDR